MDIAAEVIEYLDSATDVPWYHDVPADAPDSFGTVTRDGGPTEIVRDQPTLTLQCYGATRGAAADLADEVKHAMLEMRWAHTQVFGCDIAGDYYDPVDGMCRHRVTADLLVND